MCLYYRYTANLNTWTALQTSPLNVAACVFCLWCCCFATPCDNNEAFTQAPSYYSFVFIWCFSFHTLIVINCAQPSIPVALPSFFSSWCFVFCRSAFSIHMFVYCTSLWVYCWFSCLILFARAAKGRSYCVLKKGWWGAGLKCNACSAMYEQNVLWRFYFLCHHYFQGAHTQNANNYKYCGNDIIQVVSAGKLFSFFRPFALCHNARQNYKEWKAFLVITSMLWLLLLHHQRYESSFFSVICAVYLLFDNRHIAASNGRHG